MPRVRIEAGRTPLNPHQLGKGVHDVTAARPDSSGIE